MLFILGGGTLSIIILLFNWKVGIAVATVSLLLSMIPIGGYKKPEEVAQLCILKLRRNTAGNKTYYVHKQGDRYIYALDNRAKYNLDGLAYEESFVQGNIKIYESEECNVPVMKVFEIKPNDDISVAPFSKKTEYIFYLPRGTVLDENPLEENAENNVV